MDRTHRTAPFSYSNVNWAIERGCTRVRATPTPPRYSRDGFSTDGGEGERKEGECPSLIFCFFFFFFPSIPRNEETTNCCSVNYSVLRSRADRFCRRDFCRIAFVENSSPWLYLFSTFCFFFFFGTFDSAHGCCRVERDEIFFFPSLSFSLSS